jgi:hypothetical protein
MVTLSLVVAVGSYLLLAAYVMSWHMASYGDVQFGVDEAWRFERVASGGRTPEMRRALRPQRAAA